MLPTSENCVNATFTGMGYLPHRPGPPVALQLEFAAVDVRTRASSSATSTSSIHYLPSLTSALFTVMSRSAPA